MKKVLLIISAFLLLALIPVGVYYVRQRQELRSRAAPTTVVELEKVGSAPIGVGDTFTVNVRVNTNDNSVLTSRLVLDYDESLVSITPEEITLGPFFPNGTFRDPKIADAGQIDISITGGDTADDMVQGEGVLTTLTFSALSSGTFTLAFDQNFTTIWGLPDENNVIDVYGQLPVTIGGGDQLSPTPTVTLTPSPTGSITPSATGSPSPSHSPTLTPTGTRTPTLTPAGSRTVTPTRTPTPTSSDDDNDTSDSADQVLSILRPTANQSFSTSNPTFSGKANANSTITIVINSNDPITAVVTANASGNWSYTPSQALADGYHTITVTEQTTSGATFTETQSFYISQDGVPETGIITNTILIVAASALFILLGLVML
ncbi:hypothetical protein A2154_00765 [Candidatus Gottesmanbacteria bacterium RBG_16_43_7]|uniref:Bacterial Ig-like domain-containing protein n=1 Tax=Candidatus Gottesmanbacteria bacterium RBG_16_43_7 TaxID=1798373 RepID=A0A1F5Z8E4_9BACT|nr:MAG: hypothetical protein A2154_00765 [Candidatus Gottesmanbacteria bacterium RBG_16_43_7]